MDFGIRGVDPEPRAGYRRTAVRRRHLQEFSDACWQRHEAHHVGHPGPLVTWPGPPAFHSNWPLLANALIVADWRHAGAAAGVGPAHEEVELELLDPAPAPERDWQETYAVELELAKSINAVLLVRDSDGPGDGLERVLELAQLSPGERAVMRPWLRGESLEVIAEDLAWRLQTVGMLHRNALYRLRWLGQNDRGDGRGNVRGKRAGGPRAVDVSGAPAPRRGAVGESGSSRGPGPGRVRGVSAAAASG